ncbi:putative Dual specificity phosphatase, catalytic domain protein [Magnetofaba australis IT-1]|uniref:Putative Dual specificity phosphatase, catalytic domain protein n=1 Tax=Magnetofaba australis IT-1 TaxID=1434232 RepID=A0A1Y2K9K1_9PROT|nr:putative Dual specificity phosphatase, catalytic domain protein [Magnetofaba australis IT-1]
MRRRLRLRRARLHRFDDFRQWRRGAQMRGAQQQHLQRLLRVHRQIEIGAAAQQRLIEHLQMLQRHALQSRHKIGMSLSAEYRLNPHHPGAGAAVQTLQQIIHNAQRLHPQLMETAQPLQQPRPGAAQQLGAELIHGVLVGQAENLFNRIEAHRARAVHNGLIQQRQRIAHRTVSGAGHRFDARLVPFDRLFLQNLAQIAAQGLQRHALEIIALAAADDGGQNLAHFGGGEDEFDVGRRLFQGFEQGVEGALGEHVGFVQGVDAEAAAGLIPHPVEQFAHVIDAGARGGVHLQHIRVVACCDAAAGVTLATRVGGHAGLTVETHGHQPRQSGLAHPTDAGKQKRLRESALGQRVFERAHRVLLSDQIGEVAGAPFARQNHIRGHGA